MTRSARVLSKHPALGALLLITGCATQSDGHEGVLSFYPSAPTAGAVIAVEYTAVPELQGEDQLRLRARLRTSRDKSYNDHSNQVAAAQLERGRSGVFRGSFTLPPGAVFAVFAVEDLTGERVDHNGQALWELLVHGPDGRPLAAALEQKSNDLMDRNWQEAHRASRQRKELYPEDVAAWNILLFFQSIVIGPDSLEAALSEHRTKLAWFDEEYGERDDLDANLMGTMMWYARSVDDSTRTERWRTRLLDESPANRMAINERLHENYESIQNDPAAILERADPLWEDGVRLNGDSSAYDGLVFLGLRSAMRLGDEAAVRRWVDRNGSLSRSRWATGSALAASLIEHEVLTREAVADLEEVLAGYETDPHSERDLTHSVSEHRRRTESRVLRDLVALGKGRLMLADTNGARAAFRDAATLSTWNASSFAGLGQALLELGDVEAAAELAARVAVDPADGGGAAADSLIDAVRAKVTDNRWSALETEAEDLMRRVTRLEDVNRALPADPLVETDDGGQTLFSEAMGGEITLIAFWSRFCGPSIQELPQLQETAFELSQLGVRTLAITDEAASPELAEFLDEQGFDMPIYHDLRREASLSLNQYATPSYYLLDGRGRIRFEDTSLEAVRRQVRALERDP